MKRNVLLTVMILALFAVIGLSVDSALAANEASCEEEINTCFALVSGTGPFTYEWEAWRNGAMTASKTVTKSSGVDSFAYCNHSQHNQTFNILLSVKDANGNEVLGASYWASCSCP